MSAFDEQFADRILRMQNIPDSVNIKMLEIDTSDHESLKSLISKLDGSSTSAVKFLTGIEDLTLYGGMPDEKAEAS
jgi:hypothetical protein